MKRSLPADIALLLITVSINAFGWGGDAHRLVNRSAVRFLPESMMRLIADSAFLAAHAPDADYRKDYDDTTLTAEATRHYIDIDDYPDYGNLPRNFGAVAALYGWSRAKGNGVLPWAVGWTYDSLVAQLRRNDWNTALRTAADLGHYVADAHQPLHTTRNYDGQYTGNDGIHYRYESVMLNARHYLPALIVVPDSVRYVADPVEYLFEIVLHSVELVDSIMRADDLARQDVGWDGSGTPPDSYYAALWQRTRFLTLGRIQRSAQAVADLWFSAWANAGLLSPSSRDDMLAHFAEFELTDIYPNPAVDLVSVRYRTPESCAAAIELYTITGIRIAEKVLLSRGAGVQDFSLATDDLPAGPYLLLLRSGASVAVSKLIIMRR